jgi:transposase InsO family protein
MRFIEQVVAGGETFSALCEIFGVSRKTGYKRLWRYRAFGLEGIGDRSRAPYRHPNQTPAELVELILKAKQAYPTWGPGKLVSHLATERPDLRLPAASTAGEILKRRGLVKPRKRRRRIEPWRCPFASCHEPNDVWCTDFKGWFRTGDGIRCDPLTISDACTRYLIACKGMERPRQEDVRREFERAFREYGLPGAIRSDNGTPFASVALGGLTKLSVWWIKLGIVPERIAPGHPEQNGRHERMHRTLKEETASPPARTMRAQQRTFDRFRAQYNDVRPHEALGQRPPASRYSSSPRDYPSHVREPEYPDGMTVRRVRSNGEIKWQGGLVFLSAALTGEPVGLRPQDDDIWTVHFGPLEIGTLDQRAQKVLRTPRKVLPMSPV